MYVDALRLSWYYVFTCMWVLYDSHGTDVFTCMEVLHDFHSSFFILGQMLFPRLSESVQK